MSQAADTEQAETKAQASNLARQTRGFRRRLKRALLLLILLLLIPTVLLYCLLGTTAGNEFVLQQLSRFEPRFEAQISKGNLLSSIEFQELAWKGESLHFYAQGMQLAWDWSCLQHSRVCIQNLATEALNLKLSEEAGEQDTIEEADEAQKFLWPFDFSIQQASLKNAELDIYKEHLSWQSISLSLKASNMGKPSLSTPTVLRPVHDEQYAQLLVHHLNIEALHLELSASKEQAPANAAQAPGNAAQALGNATKGGKSVQKKSEVIVLPEVNLPFELLFESFNLHDFLINQRLADLDNFSANKAQAKENIFTLEQAQLRAMMRGTELKIAQLKAALYGTHIDLNGDITLQGDYALDVYSAIEIEANEQLDRTQVDLSLAGSVAQLQVSVLEKGRFNLEAELKSLEPHLPFKAKLDWKNLAWPLKQSLREKGLLFNSQQGLLSLHGDLQAYDYHFTFDIVGKDVPAAKLSSYGRGDLQSLNIEELVGVFKKSLLPERLLVADNGELKPLDPLIEQRLKASGKLTWQPNITWQGELELSDINLQGFAKGMEGALSARSQLEFELGEQDWRLLLEGTQLQAQLNGHEFSLDVAIQGQYPFVKQASAPYGQWNIKRLQVLNHQNRLIAKGRVDQNMALELNADLVQWQALFPEFSGQFHGALRLSGPSRDPKLSYKLQAQELQYSPLVQTLVSDEASNSKEATKPSKVRPEQSERFWLRSLLAEGELYIAQIMRTDKKAKALSLDMSLLGLNYQDSYFAKSTLSLRGNRRKHHLNIDVDAQPFASELSLAGSWVGEQWQGRLLKAQIESEQDRLALANEFTAVVNVNNMDLSLDEHCWQYSDRTQSFASEVQGQLCVQEFDVSQQQKKLALGLDNVDLAIANRFIEQQGQIEGSLNAQAEVLWPQGEKPRASMKASLGPTSLDLYSLINRDEEIETLHIESGDLQLELDNELLKLAFVSQSSSIGDSELQVDIRPYQQGRPIEGQLRLDELSLNRFLPLLPQFNHLQGHVKADVGLSGSLDFPLLSGGIYLQDVSASGDDLPLEIKQLEAELKFEQQTAQLKAQSVTHANGEYGEVNLSGKVSWQQLPLMAEFDLTGQDLVIANNIFQLKLEPELHLSLQEQHMLLSGMVRLPEGRVKMRELPQEAVTESSDVVIVSKESKAVGASIPLFLDLQLDIEDEVEIDAFGLKSQLDGRLVLKQSDTIPFSANGEVFLIDGTYTAWGQNLLIKQGQLIFSGVLSKPYLNIDAIRDPRVTEDGVTAGLRVKGASESPEVEIYSEPSKSQQDAISYLLRGKSLNSGSNSGNDGAISAMLLGFGLGQGEGLISNIGNNLGIRDLSIATKGEQDDTMVEVKGYILPGVEVAYGVSLSTNTPQITVSYEILPKLYLEGVSGIESALDLLYEFEL